jgi:hypothetical protein
VRGVLQDARGILDHSSGVVHGVVRDGLSLKIQGGLLDAQAIGDGLQVFVIRRRPLCIKIRSNSAVAPNHGFGAGRVPDWEHPEGGR